MIKKKKKKGNARYEVRKITLKEQRSWLHGCFCPVASQSFLIWSRGEKSHGQRELRCSAARGVPPNLLVLCIDQRSWAGGRVRSPGCPEPSGQELEEVRPVSGTAVQAGWLYCCLKLKFKGRSSKLQDVCVSHWDGGSSSGAERARHWGMS